MSESFKIIKTPEFNKDFKALEKRYRTLSEDFHNFINAQLAIFHLQGIDNGGIVQITGLGGTAVPVFKAKRFACKSMKGKGSRTGIRIIYSYSKQANQLTFIEMYSKADKENEDQERIKKYFQTP